MLPLAIATSFTAVRVMNPAPPASSKTSSPAASLKRVLLFSRVMPSPASRVMSPAKPLPMALVDSSAPSRVMEPCWAVTAMLPLVVSVLEPKLSALTMLPLAIATSRAAVSSIKPAPPNPLNSLLSKLLMMVLLLAREMRSPAVTSTFPANPSKKAVDESSEASSSTEPFVDWIMISPASAELSSPPPLPSEVMVALVMRMSLPAVSSMSPEKSEKKTSSEPPLLMSMPLSRRRSLAARTIVPPALSMLPGLIVAPVMVKSRPPVTMLLVLSTIVKAPAPSPSASAVKVMVPGGAAVGALGSGVLVKSNSPSTRASIVMLLVASRIMFVMLNKFSRTASEMVEVVPGLSSARISPSKTSMSPSLASSSAMMMFSGSSSSVPNAPWGALRSA